MENIFSQCDETIVLFSVCGLQWPTGPDVLQTTESYKHSNTESKTKIRSETTTTKDKRTDANQKPHQITAKKKKHFKKEMLQCYKRPKTANIGMMQTKNKHINAKKLMEEMLRQSGSKP